MTHQVRVQPALVRRRRCAPLLVWGLVLLVVGQWLYVTGEPTASAEVGIEQVFFGQMGALVGLVLLAIGVHRLASHVDRLVGAR